jgi:uncharacterized damage-inducible protein DinB
MTLDETRSLFEYNAWANGRLLSVLDTMPNEKLFEDTKSSFVNIHSTLVHICGAEEIWLMRLVGESNVKLITPRDLPKYEDVKARMKKLETAYLKYISGLTYEKTNADLMMKNARGEPVGQKVWMVLQHIVNHSTHHRGQITTLIRQLGGTPINLDLINFYRSKK